MRNKETKIRYILKLNDMVIGQSPTIDGIGELLGCTKQHIYQRLSNGTFTYKKLRYTIVDKLD